MDAPTAKLCWYHVVLTTYGAWLDGDPRGFRTRNHRKHVEGDYKSPPPPGSHARRLRRSEQLLVQEPVSLTSERRPVVGGAIKERLEELGCRVLSIAVGKRHVHVQAKLPFGQAKRTIGVAKRHAWHVLHERDWKGKLWAKGCKPVPIKTRRHQVRVFRYITRHVREGAWVWHWKKDQADGNA